jgi:hypothetical protein
MEALFQPEIGSLPDKFIEMTQGPTGFHRGRPSTTGKVYTAQNVIILLMDLAPF